MPLKLAPSPPLTYSAPSAPKRRSPTEWLGNCWHQSLIRTCSVPVITLPAAVSFDSRPLTTQPSVVGPGGVGQASFQTGAVPPIGASKAYSTYIDGSVGNLCARLIPMSL